MDLSKIQHYITNSLADSAFYTALSKEAPTEEYRLILSDIADKKSRQADTLRSMYREETGKGYAPPLQPATLENSFPEMLRSRVLRETNGYSTYINEVNRSNRPDVQNTFSGFAADENSNAIKLLYMLSRY